MALEKIQMDAIAKFEGVKFVATTVLDFTEYDLEVIDTQAKLTN